MDPFSAILLIGLFTVATVKTSGTAVTDGLAQAKGQTPPSLEKWRANQEQKRQRGEQPREDPGGLKRIWQQHTEAAAERSAAKHRGTMEYLREHGDDIAEGKKKQLERSARRRQVVGGTLAHAGGSSWEALKTAAAKAQEARRAHGERKAEDEAWRENDARDEDAAHNRNARHDGTSEPEPGDGPDATVLEFTSRTRPDGQTEVEVTPGDSAFSSSPITGDPSDPSTWRGTDEYGRDIQTGRGESVDDGHGGVVHDTGEYELREESPQRRIVREHQNASAAQKGSESSQETTDPDEAAQRTHEAEQAQAEREHAERLAQIQQTNSNDQPEGDAMSTPQSGNTEITDLTTAQQRAKESQQYAGKVQAVLSDQLASIQAALAGMQAEAQMQESASGSLSGEGFNSRITGKFDNGAEAFHTAIAALQQQVQALQTSTEQVDEARAEMKNAATFFGKQQGLADEIGAAKQDGGVSKRTDFYAQSGA